MLEIISGRYAPSRVLSFDMVHVFKALQLMKNRGYVSRSLLCQELVLGEGTIKTLLKHLKMHDMIKSTNTGTKMTNKATTIFSKLLSHIPVEMNLPRCSIALGKFNYVVLLKQFSFAIKSGVEQRDSAIKMGALGATTMLFRDGKFVMPDTNYDSLKKEPYIYSLLIENLKPEDEDIIIIGSDDLSEKTAELAAKSAALLTIINHERPI
jgi:hypothetical protein